MLKCDDAAAATNRLSSYSSSSSASTIGLSSSITYDVYNGGHDEACEHWLPAKAPPTIQYYMAAKNALSKSPSAADCRYHYTCDVNNPAFAGARASATRLPGVASNKPTWKAGTTLWSSSPLPLSSYSAFVDHA